MLKRSLKTFAVLAVLVCLASVPALAESQLDQEQTTRNTYAYIPDGGASQSFTAGKTGKLDKVSLEISCCVDYANIFSWGYSTDLVVRVAGTEAVAHADPLYSDLYWLDVPLNPAPDVVAGQKYYIDVWPLQSTGIYAGWGISTSDVYSGGELYSLNHDNGDTRVKANNWDAAFRTYVTPSEAPVLTDTTPDDGDTGVERNIEPTATFDRELDPDTVTSDSVKLEVRNSKRDKWVSVNSSPSYADKTITVDPENDLGARKEYRVTLRTAIKSSTGEELGSEERWSFTTK